MTEDIADYELGDLQGTEEWHEDRAGCITASRMADLRWEPGQFFKSGPRKGHPKPPPLMRETYIDQVVGELLTGKPKENVRAKSLDHGHEMEPEAIAEYERQASQIVEQVGFMRHPDFSFIGASPDLLIGADGGGEVKCPMSSAVHAATLRRGLPREHIEQIQGGLWVTGRLWWDFISYHRDFPEHLRLYVQRVHRDNAYIELIKRDCLSAWDEVQRILEDLNRRAA